MIDIEQSLAVASEHHRAGRTAEAERLYNEILSISPGQADALHLLGVLRLQAGRPAEAVDMMRQAIASDAKEPVFHSNLGHALNAMGRTEDAAMSFAQSLLLLCNSGDASTNIGALSALIRRYPPEIRRNAAAKVAVGYALGDVMRRCSLLFHLSGDIAYYEELVSAMLSEPRRFTLPSLHYAYWGIAMQLFQGQALRGDAGQFHTGLFNDFYRLLVKETSRRCGVTDRMSDPVRRSKVKKVALVTNQMLGEGHQPTVDAFDLALRLQDDCGCEVAIINANTMAAVPENGFVPEYAYNVTEDYRGEQVIAARGGRVKMISFPERRFDAGKVVAIVDAIEALDPDAIVAFGGSNIISDLFAPTRAVVCVPTTSGLTHSLARIVLGYSAEDTTGGRSGESAKFFRPFVFGFATPPSGVNLSRSDFGLPESGDLFAVVGNRLDVEVADSFLDLADAVLDRLPNAVFVFAGAVSGLPARLAARRHGGRLLSLGHVADVRALYRLATAFVNPIRQGGGGSAAFALAEGLPVVTMGGDVAAVAGAAFTVGDPEGVAEACVALATDADLRARRSKAARARFVEIGDRTASARRLLDYCQEAQELSV